MNSTTKECRTLTQLHMLKWPDQNVCDLEPFAAPDQRRRATASSRCPDWVHCSGGIGRAGTFIVTHHERLKIRKLKSQGKRPHEIFCNIPFEVLFYRIAARIHGSNKGPARPHL